MAKEKAGRPHEQQKAQKLIEKIKKTGAARPRKHINQPDDPARSNVDAKD